MGNNCTRSRKKSGPGARKETAAEEAQRINAAKAAEKNANGGRGRRRRRSSVRENFSSSKEGFIQTMILQALRVCHLYEGCTHGWSVSPVECVLERAFIYFINWEPSFALLLKMGFWGYSRLIKIFPDDHIRFFFIFNVDMFALVFNKCWFCCGHRCKCAEIVFIEAIASLRLGLSLKQCAHERISINIVDIIDAFVKCEKERTLSFV